MAVLLDISITFFRIDFERKNGKFLVSKHNVHFKINQNYSKFIQNLFVVPQNKKPPPLVNCSNRISDELCAIYVSTVAL